MANYKAVPRRTHPNTYNRLNGDSLPRRTNDRNRRKPSAYDLAMTKFNTTSWEVEVFDSDGLCSLCGDKLRGSRRVAGSPVKAGWHKTTRQISGLVTEVPAPDSRSMITGAEDTAGQLCCERCFARSQHDRRDLQTFHPCALCGDAIERCRKRVPSDRKGESWLRNDRSISGMKFSAVSQALGGKTATGQLVCQSCYDFNIQRQPTFRKEVKRKNNRPTDGEGTDLVRYGLNISQVQTRTKSKQDAVVDCFLCGRDVGDSLRLCADGWYKIELNRVGTGWTELQFNESTNSYRRAEPVVLPKGKLAPPVCVECYERNKRKEATGEWNARRGINVDEKLRQTRGNLADYRGR